MNLARKIQKAAANRLYEMKYSTALDIARGEVVFAPQSDGCIVDKSVREVLRGSWPTPQMGCRTKPCRCPVCNTERAS